MNKGKIFSLSCANGFDDIRKALVKRGWVEKNNCENFDFKWTLRARDLDERNLLPHQVVNHFMNSKVMTTKAGLLHKLRELPWHQPPLPLDGFFPRSYDLSDEDDTKAFYIDFKWSCAESILKHVIADGGVSPEGVPSYAVVEMALTVCHMRIHYLNFLASDSPIPAHREVLSENLVGKTARNGRGGSWTRPAAPWICMDSAEEDAEEAAPLPDWTTEQWAMLLLCPCFGSKAIQDKQISEALGVTPVPSPRGGSPISR
ncbi:hypothetical protein CYMTET_53533 [Cymbomonas tetramitiformis]|uniref:Uncharacterized protein n=1 Tax=Cymbomonas tetramitiformis TaxID=36881 RepID=A0AAE0BII7_9CHLO|nr:hypothetical protein CYMTET_53533 [Cymbomonas tetramitiformis]